MASHTRRLHNYSYEAYLEHEASSNVKHEFPEGEAVLTALPWRLAVDDVYSNVQLS